MEARNQNYMHEEVASRLIWVVFATSQFIFYYDMIWYDIYLLQLGFHPVAVVGRCIQIGKRQHAKRNNTQNNTKTQNTQNRKQKYKTKNKHKKNIKNIVK